MGLCSLGVFKTQFIVQVDPHGHTGFDKLFKI